MSATARDPASILATSIHAGDANKPFGEMTVDEVTERASELRAAVGFGPTARVAPVARAWGDFARRMQQAGAATVGELDPEFVAERAESLWLVPPRGSMLGG